MLMNYESFEVIVSKKWLVVGKYHEINVKKLIAECADSMDADDICKILNNLRGLNNMKITVYYESNTHAEEVAIFYDELIYMECLPRLKRDAKSKRMKVTESIEEG